MFDILYFVTEHQERLARIILGHKIKLQYIFKKNMLHNYKKIVIFVDWICEGELS